MADRPVHRQRPKPSRLQRGLQVRAGWWDRILDVPLLWAAVLVVACWWMLVPRSAGEVPEWSAGEVAEFDVVLSRDLEIPDPEGTEELREEARAEVPPVYDLEPRLADEISRSVSDLFAVCRSMQEAARKDPAWRPPALSELSELEVEAEAAYVVQVSECSPEIEGALVDVIRGIYDARVVDDARALERRGGEGLLVRNLATGRERRVSLSALGETVDSRSELESALRNLLLEHDAVPRRWIKPLTDLLVTNLPPNLMFDRAATAERIEAAAEAIQERVQLFQRGQVVVRRGDTVTAATAETLAAINRGQRDADRWVVAAGILLFLVVVVLGWWRLLTRLGPTAETSLRLTAVFILVILFTAFERAGFAVASALAVNSQSAVLSDVDVYLWALPHAAGAVVALMLLGIQPAVLFAVCQALIVGVMQGGEFEPTFFALASGLVAAMAAQRQSQRSAMTRVGLVVGIANLLLFAILELYAGLPHSATEMGVAAVAAFAGGPVGVALASFVLPALEDLFGITTPIRLLELSNQNLPLLKRLSMEAPGTYQHSLAVGNLAEAGAEAVGADSLLVRVAAYYHDIGKMAKPGYFVENQRRGQNPHDQLSPSMSALVIISHVKQGLEMARQAKLPLPIRQAIATHHGTKLLHYFHQRALDKAERPSDVREGDYRYPGPRPPTKELGILLLADAVEAASRSLDNPTTPKLQAVIDRLFRDALEDGQLDRSELTFKEMEKIGSAFLWVLTNMYHHRIDYPGFEFEQKGKKTSDTGVHVLGTKARDASG